MSRSFLLRNYVSLSSSQFEASPHYFYKAHLGPLYTKLYIYMTNPSAYVVILLALHMPMAFAGLSRAESADDDHGLCGVARRAMQQEIEKAQAELGKGLHTKALLNNCARAFTEHHDKCSNPENLQQMGCKPKPPAVPNAKTSITGSADQLAAGFIEDANCKRRIEQCVARGGIAKHHGKEEDAWKQCLNGDQLSFVPVPNEATPRDRDASARNQLLGRIYRLREDYKKCLKDRADAAEQLARKTLEDAAAARADGTRSAVDCIDKAQGIRVCGISENGERFTPADGQREDGPIRDPEADRDNPAQVGKDRCSGTLLGNGTDVVTAGHCLSGSGRQEVPITVRDADGQERTVTATCSGTYGGSGYDDLARCTLSQPVKANPVYFATHDPSVPGATCIDEGYTKRCGSGFFQNLTNKPVTVWGYPAGYDGLTRSTGTFTGTSESGWIWKNGVLHHNLICTGGCSGSGYIVDVGGQRVVVGAHSYGSIYGFQGGGSVPTYGQWQGLKIQSVSTEKLANATLLFTELQ